MIKHEKACTFLLICTMHEHMSASVDFLAKLLGIFSVFYH